ncbi:N-acetyl sugar amidotransferase [Planococcus sp. S3-L1]|uniref:N-acetyl sugar amidotransferase n=1 Tax=Planococcus sp. S3-L1 TaxID=3046200 RepID=UPI0024BB37B2|nr:N-acetyl sugar amidotransferase [Planococcus sp. S3-L1]MDJ0332959.1 N-acetyl sugar amidotransferase [Planococcus sp. S3-L1]
MKYQMCNRCVMDNKSDVTIYFNEEGVCNYCTDALVNMKRIYFPNSEGEKQLKMMLSQIKEEGKGKKYDCLMGISGGLDSSYLAYLGYKWGLRILAVHVDDGYDTEISKENLKKLSNKANIKLINIEPNAEQFNKLTKAFFRAGVPNLAIPQDNILFASLYKLAKEHKIKYFLSGGNFALESILQQGNTYSAYDTKHIKEINKIYGETKLDKLPILSELQRDLDKYIYKIESLRPLNLIDYNKERAFKELKDFCEFEYYGSKHLENTLTKFVQTYYFPNKFNVDKRTSHLSSLIIVNQLKRDEALKELEKPLYDEEEMEKDIEFILNKLKMSKEEFNKIMEEDPKQHDFYKTSKYVDYRAKTTKLIKKIIFK